MLKDFEKKALQEKIDAAKQHWNVPALGGRVCMHATSGQYKILRKLDPDPLVSPTDRELNVICNRCGASFWGYRAVSDFERGVFGLSELPEYSGGYLIASFKHDYYLTTVAYRCSCPVGCSKPPTLPLYDAQAGSDRNATQEDLTRAHWKLLCEDLKPMDVKTFMKQAGRVPEPALVATEGGTS